MTKVVERIWSQLLLAVVLAISMIPLGWAQDLAPAEPATHSAQDLYQQLRTVRLDKSRVYGVRDLSLERAAVHITLEDGTIAFTEDVMGRVTGAFFQGDGEILLVPPDQVERSSMALFTGSAILEEKFATAYFRFSDETYAEMEPQLRPADNQAEFVTQWNDTAKNLADTDAMRLLVSFSRLLPVAGATSLNDRVTLSDHMLHARLQGQKLGTFDVFYDDRSPESVGAGQLRTVQGQSFYDVWTSFPPTVGAPLSSRARSERVPGPEVSVSQYKISAEVRPPTTVSMEALMQVEVKRGGARTLLFELSRFLQVKQVEVDGHPVEFIHNQALEGTQLARRGNDVVAVIFPGPLKTGQQMQLHFTYGGDVLSEAGGGLLYVGARGTWYPNQGLAMANFDLEFRYPPGWTLIATGKRVDKAEPSNPPDVPTAIAPQPEQISHWVSERPIPVAGFNLGKYERATAHAGDIVVESYAAGVERAFPKGSELVIPASPKFPEDQSPVLVPTPTPAPARNAQAVADRSAQAVEFFSRRFGPYPYTDLALTQMPGDMSQGWPGLIFLSSFSYLTAHEKSQLHLSPVSTVLSNAVIAHETAHQWWGDLITWRGYHDQWISEALANYSSFMLLESEDPAQFRLAMDQYRDDLLEKNKDDVALMDAGPVTLGSRLSCSRLPQGYEAISYGRGTWLFHMLRHMLRDADQLSATSTAKKSEAGDEPFVRTLRAVREKFAGQSISTEELLHAFEENLPPSLWYEGKKSLDWFYQGWVKGTAVPRYGLQNVNYAAKGNATTVTGTILQKNAPNNLVTSIPIYAVNARRENVLVGRVFADGPETPFHVTAPAGTRRILLDPLQTVLSRNR